MLKIKPARYITLTFRILKHTYVLTALLLLQTNIAAAQPSTTTGVPALQVIAPNGATNVLIGSIHIPVDGLRQPQGAVLNGFKRYVVEGIGDSSVGSELTEVDEQVKRKLAKRAAWSDSLTEGQIDVLRKNASCNFFVGDPNSYVAEALSYKSAATAANIAITRCASDTNLLSRDNLLMLAAALRGLKPLPLETEWTVNKQREKVDEKIYRYTLYRAFTPESKEGLRRAANALNTGAYEEVVEALNGLAQSPEDAATYYRLMVAERNHAWMPILTPYLDQGDSFVNVGAAHLPGPEGLIALLRERGYTIKPILLEADDYQR